MAKDNLDKLFEGFFHWLTCDIKHIRPPKSLKIYIDENTGESASEVINHPNPYVPEVVRQLYTKDKTIIEATDPDQPTTLGAMFNMISNMPKKKNNIKEIKLWGEDNDED